jgi:predicted HD phosphohydrolase
VTIADAPLVTPLRSVDELFDLLERSAARTDSTTNGGERVGILDHGLQCADVLRRHSPDDLGLQIAGLVHDLGHVAVPNDADDHGRHGRVLFAELLGERVADLVELHVPAKRYLVTVEEQYFGGLSAGSVRTLGEQGGPMTPDEVAAFEAEPRHQEAIVLRRADEAAKIPGREVPGLDTWRPIVESFVASRRPA